jgi:ATP-dependent DNA helicase RecG
MNIMTSTTNGFVIAEKDLELRGPGEIEGTKQSGALNFKLASIVQDRSLLELAKSLAVAVLEEDSNLVAPANAGLKKFLQTRYGETTWSRIS